MGLAARLSSTPFSWFASVPFQPSKSALVAAITDMPLKVPKRTGWWKEPGKHRQQTTFDVVFNQFALKHACWRQIGQPG